MTYDEYLLPTSNIDSDNPLINSKANSIVTGKSSQFEKIKSIFEFVRDDYNSSRFDSYKASEILLYKGNLCYQRAILFISFLRAINVPSRLHFQKIIDSKREIQFLHAIVGIFINNYWVLCESTGSIKKWNDLTGRSDTDVRYCLEFEINKNCLFDFSEIERINVEVMDESFSDWTEKIEMIINQFNKF